MEATIRALVRRLKEVDGKDDLSILAQVGTSQYDPLLDFLRLVRLSGFEHSGLAPEFTRIDTLLPDEFLEKQTKVVRERNSEFLRLIPSTPGKSIQNCLDITLAGKLLDDDLTFRLPGFTQKHQTIERTYLTNTPAFMVLKVERFEESHAHFYRKSEVRLKSDDLLKVPFYDEGQDKFTKDHFFRRVAITVHQGSTPNSGHYVAYLWNADGSVSYHSDQAVRPLNKADDPDSESYMVFYVFDHSEDRT